MKTTMILSTLILGSSLAFACDSPEKAQQSADQAKREADDKAGTTRKAEQDKLQAQGNANHAQDQATIALVAAKSDYDIKIATLLSDIDKKVADIRASDLTASISAKEKNKASLKALQSGRDLVAADVKIVDSSTSEAWEATKVRVDKDMADGKATLSTQ